MHLFAFILPTECNGRSSTVRCFGTYDSLQNTPRLPALWNTWLYNIIKPITLRAKSADIPNPFGLFAMVFLFRGETQTNVPSFLQTAQDKSVVINAKKTLI